MYAIRSYYDHPLIMMAAVKGDTLDPEVEKSYRKPVDEIWPGTPEIERIDRFDFRITSYNVCYTKLLR